MKPILLPLLILLIFSSDPGLAIPADTVKICALRIEFVKDNDDRTSGDGTFMIDTVTTDPFAIDPAPHNRLYFQDQIRAAAHYFESVSAGRLTVSGDVFPAAQNGAYTVDHPMAYYNPNTTDDANNLGLSRLFSDAISSADAADPGIDFSAYDLFVIFHAGVGKDVDVGFDSTPQDIPSLYITHEFLKNSFGESFDGVPVDEGTQRITSGIIMPETENQDGYAIAIKGIFVSNIGSYLGMYDLFSPSRQRTGIGRFGLMDVGLLNMNGLVPSPPSAFSRQLMGWEKPRLIDRPQDAVQIARLGSANPQDNPTTIRLPINDDEYYLIENRGHSGVFVDSLFADLLEGRDEEPTYMELLKTYFNDAITIGESGVLIQVDDYDLGLPGAGMLIWHIDERVIREKGPQNRLNDDPDNRAVDLEEADGSQDIGKIYTLLDAGFQKELGWQADFWFSNRPDYLEDFELYVNEFSDTTAPNTRANRGRAVSHIRLFNFSDNQSDVMQFDYQRNLYRLGFPVKISDARIHAVSAGRVGFDGNPYIFAADNSGRLYRISGGGNVVTESMISAAGANPALLMTDSDGDAVHELVQWVSDSTLYSISPGNITSGTLQPPAKISFNSAIAAKPVSIGGMTYVLTEDGSLHQVEPEGLQITGTWTGYQGYADFVFTGAEDAPFSAHVDFFAVAPLNDDGLPVIITCALDQGQAVFSFRDQQGEVASEFRAVAPMGQFAVADINGNGRYEIVFVGPDQFLAYSPEGTLTGNFPIQVTLADEEHLVGSPLIADLDNDGRYDFIAATSQGQIIAVNQLGEPLPGFPLSTGSTISLTPMIVQLDGPGNTDPQARKMELIAVTDSASVYAWQLAVDEDSDAVLWPMADLNTANNVLISETLVYRSIGSSLMPEKRVYNYPNPNSGTHTTIRYYLNEAAEVKIRIFDTAGFMVDDFSGPGQARTANEIEWDVSDIASGVYLCQVEAKAGGRTEKTIIKIMVVH